MRGFENGSWLLGHLFGIPIRLHWSFVALMALAAVKLNWIALALVEVLVLTVLIHELGHCFAARSVGGEANGILLWPLGGLAFTSGTQDSPAKWAWVALAGPLTHIPLAGLCWLALAASGEHLGLADLDPRGGLELPDQGWQSFVYAILRMQVLLFCFNLCLPAYPLDGGQILVGLFSLFLPLPATVMALALLTGGTAFWLLTLGYPIFAIMLGLEAFKLLSVANSPAVDWHPISRIYSARPRVIALRSGVYVAPGLELVPCPNCSREMHPRSQKCLHCETRFGPGGVAEYQASSAQNQPTSE